MKYDVRPSGKPGLWHVMRGKHIIYEDTFVECCGIMVELSPVRTAIRVMADSLGGVIYHCNGPDHPKHPWE